MTDWETETPSTGYKEKDWAVQTLEQPFETYVDPYVCEQLFSSPVQVSFMAVQVDEVNDVQLLHDKALFNWMHKA